MIGIQSRSTKLCIMKELFVINTIPHHFFGRGRQVTIFCTLRRFITSEYKQKVHVNSLPQSKDHVSRKCRYGNFIIKPCIILSRCLVKSAIDKWADDNDASKSRDGKHMKGKSRAIVTL